jgi:methylglutaconyl-CoA hydratase
MPDTITLETDARGVATLMLDRLGKHNAMSAQMMDELHAAAGQLAEDASVRVVVLRAAGKTFCAGGDLGWMREQMSMDRAQRMREARRLADMLGALNALPKPLIGAIQGNALGGGVGLACVCDASVAVDTARFGLTETRLGLIPATIGPYVLARLGEGAARRVFMSSRVFSASDAARLGVISRSVPADQFEAEVEEEVAPYLACAPGAVAAAKKLARGLGSPITPRQIDESIEALARQWQSAEAEEGITAFFDKRAPSWARKA